ncbi:hypothetical protein B4096_0510 [Heyndrickxia coagulans]|jgi:hypothetical protein|nr:hypothetical protein B4096_0510 [Heyndrickxia coagulans]
MGAARSKRIREKACTDAWITTAYSIADWPAGLRACPGEDTLNR